MSRATNVTALYTKRTDAYVRYVERVRHRQGIQAVLERLSVLAPDERILDAGSGTGLSIQAILDALATRGYTCQRIDGFDLTEAMIARCRQHLGHIPRLSLLNADILHLARDLPHTFRGYDLVVSASMLEYIPHTRLTTALTALRERMVPGGRIVVFTTRKAYLPVQLSWKCEGYTRSELRRAFTAAGFTNVTFPHYPARYWWLNIGNQVVRAEVADQDRPAGSADFHRG